MLGIVLEFMNSKTLSKLIRTDCAIITNHYKVPHIASVFSIADILAVLYCNVLNIEEIKLSMPNRDRFILSKGHAALGLLSALKNVNIIGADTLCKYYKTKNYLADSQGNFLSGIEFCSASLGLGIGVAVGHALAAKIDGFKYNVYCLVGNGECNEGSVWESIMFASSHNLNNFKLIIDNNNMQALGKSSDILDMSNLSSKLKSFGFSVRKINGHNHKAIKKALLANNNKPTAIICNTIKGFPVSFMKNQINWHYDYIKDNQLAEVLSQIKSY